jgi:uncharacterized membrane protein
MVNIIRTLNHLLSGPWLVSQYFTKANFRKIEEAIAQSESRHSGEIRFAVEHGLHLPDLLRGISPRERAVHVFSDLRIWDTEHNNGILLYLLLPDRAIEIVADRGILSRVPQTTWDAICSQIEAAFKQAKFEEGVIQGLQSMTALLAEHFPACGENPNELPNQAVML